MYSRSHILIFLFLSFTGPLHAQKDTMETWIDTSLFSLFGDDKQHNSSDYIHSIERAYDVLNRVQNDGQLGYNIQNIRQQVIEDDSAIQLMRQAVRNRSSITIRNMQMYRQILLELQEEMIRDRNLLNIQNTRLENLEKEMLLLTRDKMLIRIMSDSAALVENKSRLRRLQRKWRRADSLIQSGLDTVNLIRTEATDNTIAISEMLNRLNSRLRRTGIRSFGKEKNYLWEADSGKIMERDPTVKKATDASRQRVLKYYVGQRQNKIVIFALCFGLFLWWVSRTYRFLYRNDPGHAFSDINLTYLNTGRVAASVVAIFCFVPFFDIYAPSSFTEVVQLIIILALSFILYRRWPRKLFSCWIALALIFTTFFLFNTPEPTPGLRCIFLLLNIACIVTGLLLLKRIEGDTLLQRLVKVMAVVYILLNIMAMICNLYGRITLAQTLRNAGIYGVTQIVALAVTLQILKEAVLLQIQSSRTRRGITQPFDVAQVSKSLQLPLLLLIIVLWLVMFAVNMNLYDVFRKLVIDRLTNPIHIGSASFTLGSVALFFIIIWIAHLLQRYTGYIFGDIGHEDEGLGNKEQRSKLLISKLVILMLGYFLAVAASGLPIDKITIVLGALGVGIGLGLQNIVSNFISGIILIFDRPLQIGDSIEVGSKAGRVKEIGMRASTLLTPEGAEVIIPNGDILSQQITNWTLSNNYKRLELSLALSTDMDKDMIVPMISAIIASSEFAYDQREPVVLVDSVKPGELKLKAFFWCNDIYKADQVKSEVRYMLYRQLKDHDIEVK